MSHEVDPMACMSVSRNAKSEPISRWRARALVIGPVFLLTITSCGSHSAAQMRTALQTAASWAATAHMAGEAWISGAVPTAYTRRTLHMAEQTLVEGLRKVQDQPATSAASASVPEHLQSLKHTLSRMREAVQTEDRMAMTQHMTALANEEEALRALRKGVGGLTR
jgi:hypothetical protein